MSKEKQRELASRGGKAAHKAGTAHEWTSEEARLAGMRGGAKSAAASLARRRAAQDAKDDLQQAANAAGEGMTTGHDN